jgi:hypothetical protein
MKTSALPSAPSTARNAMPIAAFMIQAPVG